MDTPDISIVLEEFHGKFSEKFDIILTCCGTVVTAC